MATTFANCIPALSAPKVTSSFDRQAPPAVGAQAQREGESQSPQRGGGAAAGGNCNGGQGRGGQGQGPGQDYYTLSRAGITHLKDSSSDFTTLDRWEREYALFHQIRRLDLKNSLLSGAFQHKPNACFSMTGPGRGSLMFIGSNGTRQVWIRVRITTFVFRSHARFTGNSPPCERARTQRPTKSTRSIIWLRPLTANPLTLVPQTL